MDFLVPVLDSSQMAQCDKHCIQNEPIQSFDLMERAARMVYNQLKPLLLKSGSIGLICGPGNNGGDGLAIARMLAADGFSIKVVLCLFHKTQSADNLRQLYLLKQYKPNAIQTVEFPTDIRLTEYSCIIDALLGTGLRTEAEDEFSQIIHQINQSPLPKFSIDMPSGLLATGTQKPNTWVKAQKTIAIQAPKPSFFYAENQVSFELANASIDTSVVNSNTYFLSPQTPWREKLLKTEPQKSEFDHKGKSGHVLLVGGNKGMHGAIALSAESCISAGAGRTTVWSPAGARLYLGNLPKAMHLANGLNSSALSKLTLDAFTTLAVGPGLGKSQTAMEMLRDLLGSWNKPALLDADALNILASNRALWGLIKPNSILTPHPGEFQRLFGETESGEAFFKVGKKAAEEKQIYIVAKNRYTHIFCPDGKVFINGSGNSALGQGGSGDCLTGHIAAIWGIHNDPFTACMYGVYKSGLA